MWATVNICRDLLQGDNIGYTKIPLGNGGDSPKSDVMGRKMNMDHDLWIKIGGTPNIVLFLSFPRTYCTLLSLGGSLVSLWASEKSPLLAGGTLRTNPHLNLKLPSGKGKRVLHRVLCVVELLFALCLSVSWVFQFWAATGTGGQRGSRFRDYSWLGRCIATTTL